MGVMAGELGLDVTLAKRIGLFHDIGKSLDHEVEGGHAVIGADLLKRHGESQVAVNAVAAHHEEVAAESLYALLASAADTISSSRIGARAETTDIYLKRLEKQGLVRRIGRGRTTLWEPVEYSETKYTGFSSGKYVQPNGHKWKLRNSYQEPRDHDKCEKCGAMWESASFLTKCPETLVTDK